VIRVYGIRDVVTLIYLDGKAVLWRIVRVMPMPFATMVSCVVCTRATVPSLLLQTPYIGEEAVIHGRAKTKREGQCSVKRLHKRSTMVNYRYMYMCFFYWDVSLRFLSPAMPTIIVFNLLIFSIEYERWYWECVLLTRTNRIKNIKSIFVCASWMDVKRQKGKTSNVKSRMEKIK